jgi:MoxR-like ATPase
MSKFRKSLGTSICGRYGNVLGRPGMKPGQEDKLAKHVASQCDAHGEQLPPVPVKKKLLVVLPDPSTRGEMDKNLADACSSCAMCQNFVRDDVVADELGWTAGLCAAKGKLILPNEHMYEARVCEYKQFGTVRTSTVGLHLLPEFEDAFQLNSDPIKAYFKNKDEIVLPQDYPTDREVTAEEAASGIRAWRRVNDPEGSGNEAFLPIYGDHIFSPQELEKIPRAGDDEHPELYVDHFGGVYMAAIAWTELDETPALWGEAGVGKTELFRHLAYLMHLPFERISITASTELDDLVGKMHYEPTKGTYFQYGRLPKAWTKPGVVCIDEPNVGQPDVWQFLRPLTDNSKQMVIDQNEGERRTRHADCYMGMAMNPAWDPKNVGAATIGDADARRLWHIFIDLPPEVLEREIIKNRVALDGWELDEARLQAFMTIASEIRGLCKEDTLPITWGIAQQIKVARASRWFDMVTSYRRAIGDYLEPEAQEVLLNVVRANVGS